MTYVELHCHSAYSFLDGASHPDELAAAAAEQGHRALALTDHDGLHGAMEFAQAVRPLGLKPITGAELTLEDGHHLTLLCESARGYRNLCRLVTSAHAGTRGEEVGTTTRIRPPVHPPRTSWADLERHAEGLICLSGCVGSGVLAARVEHDDHAGAVVAARRLVAIFGRDCLRVELQRPFGRHDRRRNRLLAGLAERLDLATVATGNVHCHDRSRTALQDALVAVRLGATLDESEPGRRGNSSHVLAPPEAMARRFSDHRGAVEESGRIAERIEFDLTSDLGYAYPGAEDPTADSNLAEICQAALEQRYRGRRLHARARDRLDEELRIIRALGLSGFFLLHRDMLELAREVAVEVRGHDGARAVLPPGRGRGSSVSSIVCYLTGLSHVDPVEKELFLGRFLNEELSALPDIDLDFPRDIRERLIPRVHARYGRERSALVAAFPTYRVRGAIRDFGKALGLPPGEIERSARSADPWGADRAGSDIRESAGERAASPRRQALERLIADSQGLPRHVGQHPGGMVVSTTPLVDLCPIQPAAMDGRQIVQWDKDSCADAGFLKIDLLGLGMLSAIENCISRIGRARNERIDLSRIPLDDGEVYARIQEADTMGVFQIESRAQMQSIVRTRPESLDDLTVQVALVRPGPIQGGAVHPYIERRKRLRADPGYQVPYLHPALEPVLRDTLGAIVFQDQVIEVAMALAGFSPGEAEGLRRAMSKRRSEAAMRSYEQKFIEGAIANGASQAVAEQVYAQIVGFSGFGFPKAHSAAFGLLAYQSTWLRVHYGPEFLCALLNEQPMGFYPPDALVHEAKRRGIPVLGPGVLKSDVECSVEWVWVSSVDARAAGPDVTGAGPVSGGTRGRDADDQGRELGCTTDAAPAGGDDAELSGRPAPARKRRAYVPESEGRVGRRESASGRTGRTAAETGPAARILAVRIGLGYVNSMRTDDVRDIVEERSKGGPFKSIADLAARCSVQRDALERLAWAGACDELVDHGRREALWLLGAASPGVAVSAGTQLSLGLEPSPAPALPDMTAWEGLLADYGSTGVTLREHPLELMRPGLPGDLVRSAELAAVRDGEQVRVAGLVVARQRPATAKGITFMLLEDERGMINLIVPTRIYERDRLTIRGEPLVLADGRLERREGVTNILVARVARLERPDLPRAEVRHIEPRAAWSTDDRGRTGTGWDDDAEVSDLRAVVPAAHSFGRRGR